MSQDVETRRLAAAAAAMPDVVARYDDALAGSDAPGRLWRRAAADVQAGHLDDRPLYWARLKLLRALRERGASAASVIAAERRCRGFDGFSSPDPSAEPTALVTGFDPFGLHRRLDNSNPSGLAALALDGAPIAGVRVRAAMLPVRFADFDAGIVEELFARALAPGAANPPRLVLTISMGRGEFDLERFPGRRRSSEQPDNRNAGSGATEARPLPPPGLHGPEFLEFALPADAMRQATGRWQVRDNRRVRTVQRGAFDAPDLAALADQTAVAGSGGGFLSNEIAYRCLLLRRRLGAKCAAGHLHTPAVQGWEPTALGDMVAQIRGILAAALGAARAD